MNKLFIGIILLLSACNNIPEVKTPQIPANSKSVKVDLKGGLGVISLLLPDRYDTTFTWVHYSDCGKPCEKRKYRYQPKALPVFPETGYFYKPLSDSVDQFTIVHNPYIPTEDFDNPDDKEFMTSFHDHKKWNIIHDPSLQKITSDTIEKIGGRYFSVITIDMYDSASHEYSKKLLSSTTLRKGTIDFNFELLTRLNNALTKSFIDDARYYVRSIRFESDKK